MYCHALWKCLLRTTGMLLFNFTLLAEQHMWEFLMCRFWTEYDCPTSGMQSWPWILYSYGCQGVNCNAVGTVVIATFAHINSSLLTIRLLRHWFQKTKNKDRATGRNLLAIDKIESTKQRTPPQRDECSDVILSANVTHPRHAAEKTSRSGLAEFLGRIFHLITTQIGSRNWMDCVCFVCE